MANIQTFNQTDTGTEIKDKLNNNFANLNTDKIEAADTVTLTNKTIDGANNTISNLDSTNFASTALTNPAAATTQQDILTGTLTTSGEVASFDANGNVQSSGFTISSSSTLGNSATTIPNELALHNYMTQNLAHKQFFLQPIYSSGTINSVQNTFGGREVDGIGDVVSFFGHIPSNGGGSWTVDHIKMWFLPLATGTFSGTVETQFAVNAEDVSTMTTNSESLSTISVTQNEMHVQTLGSGIATGLAIGHGMGIKYTHNSTLDLIVIGVEIKFT